jgi:hypothetical protein
VHSVTAASLALQPVDFVWLVTSSVGTGGGATELETRIAYHYRRTHGIDDNRIVKIELDPPVPEGELSFAQVFPLARHLRSLLSESRSLHAEDVLPAAGGKETSIPVPADNPKGYAEDELRGRVESARDELAALADALDGPAAPTVEIVLLNDPATGADDEPFAGALGAAFDKLEEARLTFTDAAKVSVRFLLADAETLHAALRAIAGFGIADAFPAEADLSGDAAKAALLARAHRVARRLRRAEPAGVLDRAGAAITGATPEKTIEHNVAQLLSAGHVLFGETFNWLPKFTCHNDIDLATADADRGQLLRHAVDATPGLTGEDVMEDWLQGLARVRRPLHRWNVVRTLADALGEAQLRLRPVQVPYRALDSWLAVGFPEMDPATPGVKFGISRDTLSIAAHGSAAFQTGVRQSGVLVDDWTEEIPTAEEITGISFRFNQPNAVPPQALLLAVTPEETGSWSWDDLVGTLADTLRRARQRAVEPAQLEAQGMAWNAFAPGLVSEFSTVAGADVSLDLLGVLELTPLREFYTKSVTP